MISPTPTPDAMVDPNGQVRFGVFDRPFSNINLDAVRLRKGGLKMPRSYVRFRLKEWQHFAVILPEALLSFAIVDSKFLKVSWCHFVDRTTGEHFEHEAKGVRLDMNIARQLWNERTWVRATNYTINIDNNLQEGRHDVDIDIQEKADRPAVRASLRCLHDLDQIQPLVVVLPVGHNRGMYSHKVALPLEGTLSIGERELQVDPLSAQVILDIHKAHYPRHTWWNWATCAGHDHAGHTLALNLTRNVNTNEVEFNENAFWVDGKLSHLSPARFSFDQASVLEPWHLSTVDGEVDLTFTPNGERSESIKAGIVRSVFHQPYGTFSGTIKTDAGEFAIPDLFGVCEAHDAKW